MAGSPSPVEIRAYEPSTELETLKLYASVAKELICQGYYQWLRDAIEQCFKNPNTFIVFDCPSGSGKTQTGVALMALAETKEKVLDRELVAAHFVWPSAVGNQRIYEEILQDQLDKSTDVSTFFATARQWLEMPDRRKAKTQLSTYLKHVWDHCPSAVFQGPEMKSKFLVGRAIFVLMWDEIPTESCDLALIAELRDELKVFRNIVIILCGTNSKAANVIGISTGNVGSSEELGDCWSYLVTRMPRVVIQSAPYFSFWSFIQTKADKNEEIKAVVQAISTSIEGNGNPRLINMAISCVKKVYESSSEGDFTFAKWQEEFSRKNCKTKFSPSRVTQGCDILKAQCNLLLAASAHSSLADTIIHHHYGQRAFPDMGENGCSSLIPYSRKCGGWLKICPKDWLYLGHSLYSGLPEHDEAIETADVDWQVTVFQSVQRDILLYLGCCWEKGYFSITKFEHDSVDSTCDYSAAKVVRNFWKSNGLGIFNFQNHSTPINSGSMVRVLLALSVMNAAAVSTDETSTFFEFFTSFLRQLDIECPWLPDEMLDDKVFQGLKVPRFVFPGTVSDCSISEKIGIYERSANAECTNATLYGVQGRNGLDKKVKKIYFEGKQRKDLTIVKVMECTKKLLKDECSIGILLASESPKFRVKKDGKPSKPLKTLQTYIDGTKLPNKISKWLTLESKLGLGYFINVNKKGAAKVSSFTFDAKKDSRFIMITLPKESNR